LDAGTAGADYDCNARPDDNQVSDGDGGVFDREGLDLVGYSLETVIFGAVVGLGGENEGAITATSGPLSLIPSTAIVEAFLWRFDVSKGIVGKTVRRFRVALKIWGAN
jgi:hypothetical protein